MDVKFLDIRFTDFSGVQQHFNIPASTVDEDFFTVGSSFDGSSIRGFASIHESDMQPIPDVSTAYVDPFRAERTLVMVFDIYNPRNGEIYAKDPRQVAKKAEKYLASTGIADTAYFAPEAEFYIFDDVRYEVKQNSSFYSVDSEEGAWNSGRTEEGGNLGNKTPYKGGYFPVSPVDKQADLRDDISLKLIDAGLILERAHHEVGTGGQAEINYRFDTMVHAADDILKFKYIVKNTADQWGKTATFMRSRSSATTARACTPPVAVERGQAALLRRGGLRRSLRPRALVHRRHPAARAGPPRVHEPDGELLPPPRARLRGARQPGLLGGQPLRGHPHPDHGHEPQGQAHRVPRAGCLGQPVPAFAAQLMAGLDGIKNRIEPHEPVDKDLYELPPEEAKSIPQVPGSLDAVLDALEADHDFLLEGGVFTKELIETWIDYKREKELKPLAQRPHPFEFELYYGV